MLPAFLPDCGPSVEQAEPVGRTGNRVGRPELQPLCRPNDRRAHRIRGIRMQAGQPRRFPHQSLLIEVLETTHYTGEDLLAPPVRIGRRQTKPHTTGFEF